MLNNLKDALQDLEIAFKGKTKVVLEKTTFLNNQLDLVKDMEKNSFEKHEFETITKLIEKLSIQNEYKLNLLKEFSTYVNNKK
jgi:hypothetical protein